jgi:hypothetical protein
MGNVLNMGRGQRLDARGRFFLFLCLLGEGIAASSAQVLNGLPGWLSQGSAGNKSPNNILFMIGANTANDGIALSGSSFANIAQPQDGLSNISAV